MSEHLDLFNKLLKYSVDEKATDLHLCAGSCPVMRVNKRLITIPDTEIVKPTLVGEIADAILDDKKKASLEQHRVLDFSFSVNGVGRFRCNIYQQRGSYAMAIRTLPFIIPNLSELGLPDVVATFADRTNGLVLITGATGSGKSTTLASLVNLVNENTPCHIITIEDPVEYLHRHKQSLVTQREIGEDADTFAGALRAALREDPDVIMVGEMRDPETISIALTAAETGHLVLSTMHTMGAAKAIDRVIDVFPAGQQMQVRTQLATVLEGVVSQQLLTRLDQPGMVLASEVLVTTPAVRNLIREGKHYQVNNIIQTGGLLGMQLFESDLAKLVKKGVISQSEALLRAQDPTLFTQLLNRS